MWGFRGPKSSHCEHCQKPTTCFTIINPNGGLRDRIVGEMYICDDCNQELKRWLANGDKDVPTALSHMAEAKNNKGS